MRRTILLVSIAAAAVLPVAGPAQSVLAAEGGAAVDKHVEVDIYPHGKEDRDVGLKRMEIIDKALSPEILAKKQAYIRMVESDYNTKISELVSRLTTAIGHNTVLSHVDVNFLDPEFESKVRAVEKASVSIILDRTGFERFAAGKAEPEALGQMKGLIQGTFKIPAENISIVVTPQ